MNTYKIQAGAVDWVARWREMYDREREQAEMATEAGFERHADFWRTRAKRFARVSDDAPQPDPFMQALLPDLHATDTVLDVGAGAGRYEAFLARSAAQVIAVEPSESMRAQLEQRVAEEQLKNVTMLGDAWPMVQAPEADVVLSVNVVYGVREIAPFLEGMHATARRTCYLCLGLSHPMSIVAPLWQRFHGQERHPLPAALEALNVLHQLGYPAELHIVPGSTRIVYTNWDDALEEVRERLRFVPNDERDQQIREALAEYFVQREDGRVVPRARNPFAAVVSWSKQQVN